MLLFKHATQNEFAKGGDSGVAILIVDPSGKDVLFGGIVVASFTGPGRTAGGQLEVSTGVGLRMAVVMGGLSGFVWIMDVVSCWV